MIATLKARTTFWNVAIVATALSLFAVLLYAWVARSLYTHHDGDLLDEAHRMAAALTASADPVGALELLDRQRTISPYVIVRNSGGAMMFRSARLAQLEPNIGEHEVLTHAAASGTTEEQFFTVQLLTGPVRFTCIPLSQPADAYLQLGRSLGDVDMMLDAVALASAVLIPVVIVATSFGGFLIGRRALRPIDAIATALETVRATDLSRRIEPHAPDVEVRRLTSSINHLLDRLATAFARLNTFTADVSHQLQTPLTVMKGTIDAARGADPMQRDSALSTLADEVNALTATLNDLRDFALADAESSSELAAVCVSEVFEEAAELICALAEGRGITCEVAIAADLYVWGNAVRLRQLILNLGENAVDFTPAGGRIRIEAARGDSAVVLKVSDTGAGIPSELLPQVFDRYVRGRPKSGKVGSGLGLAIVKRIVDAHGGRVAMYSEPAAGTTAVITLPLTTARPAPSASRAS